MTKLYVFVFLAILNTCVVVVTKCYKSRRGKIQRVSGGDTIKSAYEPTGPSGRSLSWFQKHEVTRSTCISTNLWIEY